MESFLILLTSISMLLAIAIGANDETFAPAIGSKRLSVNQAVALGGIIVIIGASTLGFKVAKTVGSDLTETQYTTIQVLVILLSVAGLLILGSLKGLPLSTTHTMVGSTIAMSLILGRSDALQIAVVTKIVLSWILSPILGFIGSFVIMKLILRLKRAYIKGLDDVDRLEMLFANGLLVAVCVTAFSRGANDVSNAVAPLLPLFQALAGTEDSLLVRVPLILGGTFMAIGLILIGRRVLITLGNDIVELSPTTAVAVQVATAIVTTGSASLGIPISGTHVLVSSFLGVAIANRNTVNKKTVGRIAVSAVGTPFAAALATFLLWKIVEFGGVTL